MQDDISPCKWPDCPGVSLMAKAKQANKGRGIKILIQAVNKGAQTIGNGQLVMELPNGVSYLGASSKPKTVGRPRVNGNALVIDAPLPSKKDVKLVLSLGVVGTSGNVYTFTIYYSDSSRQCTDEYRIQVALKR